jgi:hypothetical protein
VKYHDYHLKSYSVCDFGNTITLHLIFDYPDSPKHESEITFSDVVVHNFIHTGGAIITDIFETELSKISKELEDGLVEWAGKFGGLAYYNGDLEACKANLEENGYKVWTICSAIGFEGVVIAKSVN